MLCLSLLSVLLSSLPGFNNQHFSSPSASAVYKRYALLAIVDALAQDMYIKLALCAFHTIGVECESLFSQTNEMEPLPSPNARIVRQGDKAEEQNPEAGKCSLDVVDCVASESVPDCKFNANKRRVLASKQGTASNSLPVFCAHDSIAN